MNEPKYRLAVEVEVTDHAREQARERHPGFKAARIVDDVREAFYTGRYGKYPPPHRKGSSGPGLLYAWTEGSERIYAIRAKANAMLVVTTLPATGVAP